MFDALSQWGWVGLAWGEVLAAYAVYLLYLRWRARRAKNEDKT